MILYLRKYRLKLLLIVFSVYNIILKNDFLHLFLHEIIINENIKEQIINLNKYYELCNDGILINQTIFQKYLIPKISIISSVYNGEKYILRFLRSIQNQFFTDIEIIFIDDFSDDNTIKIIEHYQKEDKRIFLIKQNKKRGTLQSRNIGALKAKGEYLIFPDIDDILSNNILKECFKTAMQYNCDLIRFIIYMKNQKDINQIFFFYNKFINQPKLSTFVFYSLGFLRENDFNISNKFIKRILFIKTLNNINKFYLNKNMIYFEDGFINYALHRNANSLYIMKKIGYFYIQNNESVTNNKNRTLEIQCFLLFLNFVFENSKNNEFEKNMSIHLLKEYLINLSTKNNFMNILKYLINISKSYFLLNRFKRIVFDF